MKGDKWKLSKDVKEIEIPPKVRDVISRRIRLLGEEERDILDCASIVGEEFSSNLIEMVTDLDRLLLLKKLNNVERKYQLIHSFDGKYRFDHAKIREVLYQEMNLELRKEYHSLVAAKLEETFKENLGEVTNALAYHYYASGNGQKAIPYLLESGERARRDWAIFETIQYYSQALELMEDDEKWSRERTETLEALGGLYGLAAEHEKANEFYQKAIANTDDEATKDRLRRKIRRKKIAENNGVKLAYYMYGEGETTIFLLAWTSTAELWIPQVTYFSQKYKVVTMDMRGTGESDKPLEEYTLDMYVDDVKSVIDDLQDKNIIFVGSFIGAKIAVKYIANHQGKISKLVLLSFNPVPVDDRPGFDRKAFEENHERMLKTPLLGVKRFWEKTVPDPRYESLREWGLKSSEKTPPEIFVKSLYNLSKEDIRSLLAKIDIPTLILNGDKTAYALENVKYLKERISGSESFVFKGLGLCFLNMLAADKFNKILEEFINSGEIKN
jgi:pimeloyl-ACP methyl ester carboxylesterase